MEIIEDGDLVRKNGMVTEMLAVSAGADCNEQVSTPSFFCVWVENHIPQEELISVDNLTLIRKERRRVPRPGELIFPRSDN